MAQVIAAYYIANSLVLIFFLCPDGQAGYGDDEARPRDVDQLTHPTVYIRHVGEVKLITIQAEQSATEGET